MSRPKARTSARAGRSPGPAGASTSADGGRSRGATRHVQRGKGRIEARVGERSRAAGESTPPDDRAGRTTPGEARATLTLLVRAYCHLCDEMGAALAPIAAAHGARIETIDIDAAGNEALEAAWGDFVPVLFAGPPEAQRELCHYHFDRARVVAALTTAPVAPDAKIR